MSPAASTWVKRKIYWTSLVREVREKEQSSVSALITCQRIPRMMHHNVAFPLGEGKKGEINGFSNAEVASENLICFDLRKFLPCIWYRLQHKWKEMTIVQKAKPTHGTEAKPMLPKRERVFVRLANELSPKFRKRL